MRAHVDNALQITHNTKKDASSIIGITCPHHNGTPFQGPLVAPRASRVPTMHSCSILKPVRTPVAIFGSLRVCIYVPASCHWLISYSPIHLS